MINSYVRYSANAQLQDIKGYKRACHRMYTLHINAIMQSLMEKVKS